MVATLHPAEELAETLEANAKKDRAPDLRALMATHPEGRSLYLAAVYRCLCANKFYFDKSAGADGKGAYVTEPDGPTQLRAAVFLASYDAGLPMQTTVNLNLNADKGPTLEEATANSPALVAALEKALEQARKRQAKDEPKRVQAG